MVDLRCIPHSMQGVHRVIKSFSLFAVVSGNVKQLPCPQCKRFLSLRNAVWESGLIDLKECGLVQVLPRSAVQAVQLVRAACIHNFPVFRLAGRSESVSNSPECFAQEQPTTSSPQPLDTMAPVIPTGKELVFATAVELRASFIDNQGAPAVDRTVQGANSMSRLPSN